MSHEPRAVNILRTHQNTNDWHLLAVLILAIAVFLVGINRAPVPTIDGVVRASEARNIVKTGQWFPIVYQDKVVTDHPPLYIWMTAASFKVFGVNDFAANFPIRLCAALVVILTALIAMEVGFSRGVALSSAVILCLTRDFVLSSVRGYIEPVLELFIYAGLWFTFRQRNRPSLWPAVFAGISVWLAFFSKGPPAIWPFLAFAILLIWKGGLPRYRLRVFTAYVASFALCTLIWAAWVDTSGQWAYWQSYLQNQVLGSAVSGRGGAQHFEPFYFINILLKYYWPWTPFLVWGTLRTTRWIWGFNFSDEAIYSWIFGVFGLGFVVGFSLMKWKFWYYIAPAYPAWSLFIAVAFSDIIGRRMQNIDFARFIVLAGVIWGLVVSIYPVNLHRERVGEVMEFKDIIRASAVPGPVWMVQSSRDHNLIGTSGEWYFERTVEKVNDEDKWERQLLSGKSHGPAWILTDMKYWSACQRMWCQKSTFIAKSGETALVQFTAKP